MPLVRIMFDFLLHQHRQTIEALAHIGVAGPPAKPAHPLGRGSSSPLILRKSPQQRRHRGGIDRAGNAHPAARRKLNLHGAGLLGR